MNTRKLYEKIMRSVSREVTKVLNECALNEHALSRD